MGVGIDGCTRDFGTGVVGEGAGVALGDTVDVNGIGDGGDEVAAVGVAGESAGELGSGAGYYCVAHVVAVGENAN